jgi:hypothetical protein
MTRRKTDPVPQRELAQRLRYWIDMGDEHRVMLLVAQNPTSARSSHVLHNLGQSRLGWLKAKGVL